MSSGSRGDRSTLLPLLTHAALPEGASAVAARPSAVPVWCPRSPPRDEDRFSIYWLTVDALAQAHNTGSVPAASDLLTAAFIETRSVYSDQGPLQDAATFFRALGAECEMTVRGLPDLCAAVPYVPFWGEVGTGCPADLLPWVTLLGQVLPNPCRARAFVRVVHQRLDSPAFYDYFVRVLFGALLGVYDPATEITGVRERMVLYAAFSLNPPTAWQLAQFVELAPQFALFACRQHLFFAIQQVPAVHRFLVHTYHWTQMEQAVVDGLAQMRKTLLEDGLLPGFLSDEHLWSRCETMLFAQNQVSLCYCYRAASVPFHEKLLSEYERLTRADEKYRPSPSALQLVDAYTFASSFRTDDALSFALTDPSNWPEIIPSRFLAQLVDAKALYDNETQMTSAGALLKMIHRDALYGYEGLFCLLHAIAHRLSIRWQRLPRQWAQRQLEAVRRTGAEDPDNAGVYLVCPKCRELRASPLTFPQGFDDRARSSARFPEKVSIRFQGFAPPRLICHARNIRKHDATAKRHEHNFRKQPTNGTAARAKKIDPIAVCSDIEVLRVCLVGILLYTEVNGLVTLCVDCGTLLRWTQGCLSERGPTCGCQLESVEPLVSCDICRKRQTRDKLRTHQVLRKTGLSYVSVCRSHQTQWIDVLRGVPFFSEVRDAVLRRKARIKVGNNMIFVKRRMKRARR